MEWTQLEKEHLFQRRGVVSMGQSSDQEEEGIVNALVCLGADDLSREFGPSDPSRYIPLVGSEATGFL